MASHCWHKVLLYVTEAAGLRGGMCAEVGLQSAGPAAGQGKGLESPHSFGWYVRTELRFAGSWRGCVQSWTPASASLPSPRAEGRRAEEDRQSPAAAEPWSLLLARKDGREPACGGAPGSARQPPLTSAKKAVVVILWLSKTLLSVGMRFFTIRGSRGPACRAIALPTEVACVTHPEDSEEAGEHLHS